MRGINFIVLSFLLLSCASESKNPDPIEGPLEENYEAFRQCFVESDTYQGRHDKNQGEVFVSFTITADGIVKDKKIEKSDFKDPNFHACLLYQLRQIKFLKIKQETNVYKPLNFLPAKP